MSPSHTHLSVDAYREWLDYFILARPWSRADSEHVEGLRSSRVRQRIALGLALGLAFLVGLAAYHQGAARHASAGGQTAAKGPRRPLPERTYGSQAEFPKQWIREPELARAAALSGMKRLSDRQKVVLLQALNERTCDCGCELGSFAKCVRDDSNCPRGPQIARLAVSMAADDHSLPELLGAIDEANPPAPPRAETTRSVDQPLVERSFEPPPGALRTGPADAPVAIVVFSDYQCPYCRTLDATLDGLQRKHGDSLTVVHVHYPLHIHRRATDAAVAVQAAERQQAGLRMHRRLFQNISSLDAVELEGHAAAIGLDLPRWKSDVALPEVRQEVQAQRRLGEQLGIRNVPTFFVNGRQLQGALSAEQIEEAIERAVQLRRSSDLRPSLAPNAGDMQRRKP